MPCTIFWPGNPANTHWTISRTPFIRFPNFFLLNQLIFSCWIRFRQSNVHICHEFCRVARFRISTWQRLKGLSDHISVTIHPISKFFFAKSTSFSCWIRTRQQNWGICKDFTRLPVCHIAYFDLAAVERLFGQNTEYGKLATLQNPYRYLNFAVWFLFICKK